MLDSPNKRQRIGLTLSSQSGPDVDREKRPHSLSSVTNGSNAQPISRQIRKIQSYPAPTETEEPPPQPSDKKRLSIKHKNSLNLTIFAPSYHEQLAGVRSAPINSNFNKPIPNQQTHQQHSRANYGKLTRYCTKKYIFLLTLF